MTPLAIQLAGPDDLPLLVDAVPEPYEWAVLPGPTVEVWPVGGEPVRLEVGDWLIRDEQGRLARGTAVTGSPADELTALRRVHSAAAALEAEVLAAAAGRMTDAHRDLAQALASAAPYLTTHPTTTEE